MGIHGPDRGSRVVLVTGATTGIGAALAGLLVQTNYRVVLTARASSMDRFEGMKLPCSERLLLRPLDVANQQQAADLVEEIDGRWGGVDILVNNAGVCYRSVMEHAARDEENHQFQVNYFGPMGLVRLVLPGMRAKRGGHIINLSSVGGMMAMPTMGLYSASKFALEGASEALWYELKPWGIKVTLVEPGFVHSSSFKNVLYSTLARSSLEDSSSPYHCYYVHLTTFIERMMCLSPTTPEHIAAKIIRILGSKRPPLRVSATWDAVVFSMMRRVLPQRIYHQLLYLGLPRVKSWVPNEEECRASST